MERRDLINQICDNATDDASLIRFLTSDKFAFSQRFRVGSHLCYSVFPYLPYSSDIQPDIDERTARDVVMDFKKGISPGIYADIVAAAILAEPDLKLPPETLLFHIPASTIEDDERRFRRFCSRLAQNLGIEDGFPLIELVMDRERSDMRRMTRLANGMILMEDIAGRACLVVDDVYSSGRSFKQMADYLKSAGARSVTGVFLAKTVKR